MSLLLRPALALLLLAAWIGAAPSGDAARAFDPVRDVQVEAFLSHDAVAPGARAQLAVVFRVPKDHHITDRKYDMFFVEADTTEHLRLDALRYPAGIPDHGETIYRGDVTVVGEVSLAPGAQGVLEWRMTAGYQVCSETGDLTCYMPVEKELLVRVPVATSAAAMQPLHAGIFGDGEPAPEDEGLEGRLIRALQAGSWAAFLLVFLGGVLSSLTPCVYPVIPITISFIGARSRSKLHGFVQSLFFVLGMALVYSVLGLVAAAGGGSFGAFGQSPAMQAAIAAIFLVFAASMFGAFELQLPSSVSAKLQSGDRSGPFGAILMGAVTGFIAAPCVGPIIAVLLVFIASTGSLATGFFLMLSYALGMGLLFLVIGTFAGAMSALPGAGGWMETVKKFFGVVMVAMALWFLRGIIPAGWMPWLAGAGLVIFGVWTGAFQRLEEESSGADKFYKAVGVIAVVIGVRYLLFGFGAPAALPGGAAGMLAEPGPRFEWEISSPQNDIHDGRMAEAAAQGQPVIVDFWAEWCAQCKELDHKTWIDPAVHAEGLRFTRIKMDMTRSETDWAKRQNADFGVVGMPTVIFYDGSGREARRFVGFQKADAVLEMMRAVR
jgi:thioredoxin:protein disulfide reductase